jgi:Xanthine dehydrogenase, iron-sulfur cluster and FAD-binding subunit A
VISSTVKFLLNDKILEINSADPNQTILNYIRTELKKTGTKEGKMKVVVEHAPL